MLRRKKQKLTHHNPIRNAGGRRSQVFVFGEFRSTTETTRREDSGEGSAVMAGGEEKRGERKREMQKRRARGGERQMRGKREGAGGETKLMGRFNDS